MSPRSAHTRAARLLPEPSNSRVSSFAIRVPSTTAGSDSISKDMASSASSASAAVSATMIASGSPT